MNVADGLLLLLLMSSAQQSAPAGTDPAVSSPSSSSSSSAASTAAARQASAPTQTAAAQPTDLPVSLKRIKQALAGPSQLKVLDPKEVRDGRPVFRVDIEADKIDIKALLGNDLLRGPVPYGGMTHQEFLDLVTPNSVKGYAAFSNGEGITVAATSIALQWAVLKAIDQLKKANDARAKEAARKEVEQAIEALKKARKAAGLDEK
jgi:hypothetical protein